MGMKCDCNWVNKTHKELTTQYYLQSYTYQTAPTVKPRPEAHMDTIRIEVFLKSIDLIPQQEV